MTGELAELFEATRPHLRGVAYRMLGSLSEAEDAVQEAWLRLSRADADSVDNLGGWLTTVVARICLDMLRAKKARREEPIEPHAPKVHAPGSPEEEAAMADAVGLALLVVLNRLEPAERIAFVLHDVLGFSFDEIAAVVQRSPEATRQLASRARRRVRGERELPEADLAAKRRLVDAFLAAARSADIAGMLAVLDPQATLRGDATAQKMGGRELAGAEAVAKAFAGRALAARVALLDGDVGIVVAPHGRLLLVLTLGFAGDRIANIRAVADRSRLASLEIAAIA